MAEQTKRGAGAGDDAGRTPLLPDLVDIDLRSLRAREDPALLVAAARIISGSRHPTEIWYSDEGQ